MKAFSSFAKLQNGKKPVSTKTVIWAVSAALALSFMLIAGSVLLIGTVFKGQTARFGGYDFVYDYDFDAPVNVKRGSVCEVSFMVPRDCDISYPPENYDTYALMYFQDYSGAYLSVYFSLGWNVKDISDAGETAKAVAYNYGSDYTSQITADTYAGHETYDFTIYPEGQIVDFRLVNCKGGVAYLELSAPSAYYADYSPIYKDFLDSITFDEE